MTMKWKSTDEHPLGKGNQEDGFTLYPDYEDTRLFAFSLNNGRWFYALGSIADGGEVIDDDGNEMGYSFECIGYYCDITSPNTAPTRSRGSINTND